MRRGQSRRMIGTVERSMKKVPKMVSAMTDSNRTAACLIIDRTEGHMTVLKARLRCLN